MVKTFLYWLSAKLFDLAGKFEEEKKLMSATGTTLIDPNSLEGKIDQAALEAGQIASTFSPAIGAAVQAGVAFEPMIHGMISLFAGLFHHHAKSAVTPPATVAPAPVVAPAAPAPAPAPAPVIVLPATPAVAPAPAVTAPVAPTADELRMQIAKLQEELNELTNVPPVQATPPAGHPTSL